MIRVAIVGTGTVSQHLTRVFSLTEEVVVTEILSSRGEALRNALKLAQQHDHEIPKLTQPDVYIIAVSDDAISTVSQQFKKIKQLIVHTSGSVAMSTLPEGSRRGVFYPLQTFSKGRKVDFSSIPICLEAEQEEDLVVLKKLARSISNTVVEISSKQRQSLHLAAVFVNNFTNQIYQIGNEICEENNVPFDILKPLIMETAAKINMLSPFQAQTGPAKRNDEKTIENHISKLDNLTHKEVYRILTKSIKETVKIE